MRSVTVAAVLAAVVFTAPAASADDPKPDAAHLAKASSEFDAGVAAFKKKDFEGSAAHFEEADAAVPSPKTLRQAIRARSEASQGARAATLAAAALARYPDDAATAKLAKDVISKYEPVLHKVHVRCSAPCTITVLSSDGATLRLPGGAAKGWTVYLDPGSATVASTFVGQGAATVEGPAEPVEAKAGGEGDLAFDPVAKPVKKAAPPPPPVTPGTPSGAEAPPEDAKPADEPKTEGKGISPAFFGIGLGATVVLGVTTIWSGVDTIKNPGAAAVMMACQGKGPSCPLYEQGVAKQTRTNALIGATVGTAVVTGVLAVFTRWKGAPKPTAEPAAEPSAMIVDRGAVLGASGVF